MTRRTAELTEANQRLQEEIAVRSRLATIIEATSDAVGTSDLGGKLQYLNRAARQLLGVWEEADLDAMLLTDLFSPQVQLNELNAALQQAAARIREQQAAGLEGSLPTTVPSASPEPTDRAVIAELLLRPNGAELIKLYIEEAQEFLTALTSAVATGNALGVQAAAHSLKGMSGQVGAVRVAALAQAIERAARQGSVVGETSTMLAEMQMAFERTRLALLAALAGPNSEESSVF